MVIQLRARLKSAVRSFESTRLEVLARIGYNYLTWSAKLWGWIYSSNLQLIYTRLTSAQSITILQRSIHPHLMKSLSCKSFSREVTLNWNKFIAKILFRLRIEWRIRAQMPQQDNQSSIISSLGAHSNLILRTTSLRTIYMTSFITWGASKINFLQLKRSSFNWLHKTKQKKLSMTQSEMICSNKQTWISYCNLSEIS